jgi:hypothetical protein
VSVIITFSEGPRITDRREVRRLGGAVDHEFHLIPALLATLSESGVEEMRQRPGVESVEENTLVHLLEQ